jgi:hypothetical protein
MQSLAIPVRSSRLSGLVGSSLWLESLSGFHCMPRLVFPFRCRQGNLYRGCRRHDRCGLACVLLQVIPDHYSFALLPSCGGRSAALRMCVKSRSMKRYNRWRGVGSPQTSYRALLIYQCLNPLWLITVGLRTVLNIPNDSTTE